MNLDELKTKLAEQDVRLDQAIRLNTTAVRELGLAKTKSSLHWLVWGVVLELVLTVVAVVWLGDFMVGHLQEPHFLLPAIFIDLSLIALIGAYIRQLMIIAGLNYSFPVVTLQKELGKLRILRIRTTQWTMILSFALWFPVLVVLLEGLLGVDLWLVLGAAGNQDSSFLAWMVANILFGVAVALVIIWLSRRYTDRADHSPKIKRLMDDLAGRSLTKALTFLDAIVRFEAEPQERSR